MSTNRLLSTHTLDENPIADGEQPEAFLEASQLGGRALQQEADALYMLAAELKDPQAALHLSFTQAVHEIVSIAYNKRNVLVTGIGKSGYIGQKIAGTLSSLKIPAHFLDPVNTSHGDLGKIVKGDGVIAISNSGDSEELIDIIKYAKKNEVLLIGITSNKKGRLYKKSDVRLLLPKVPEACPLGLAPTTSTTMALGLGDALAIAAMQQKGCTRADFKSCHPGGTLGKASKKTLSLH